MNYTLQGFRGSRALVYQPGSALRTLLQEQADLANRFEGDADAEHPDFIVTLEDPKRAVPGGEHARPVWLEGARAIRATLQRLVRDARAPRLCVCRFGVNDDGSASLDVAVHMPKVTAQVRNGDEVNQGALAVVSLDNGKFQVAIAPRIYRVVCANGAISFDRLGHVHRSEVQTPDSARKTIETGLRRCLLDSESFYREVETLRAADREFVADPERLLRWVEWEANIALSLLARLRALQKFSGSPRRTRWDLLNAVTAQAHHAPDARRARDTEALGGFIGRRLRIPARHELHIQPLKSREIPQTANVDFRATRWHGALRNLLPDRGATLAHMPFRQALPIRE